MKFLVTLTCGEDGYVIVECPALPGCMSQGRSKPEALSNIREAIEAVLLTQHDLGIDSTLEIAELEVTVPAK